APLLQRWFATTSDPAADDPYFLYAASNLGSLGGLLAYPLLIEPLFRLRTQSHIWTMGYMVLVALIIVCASRVWRVRAVSGANPKRDAVGAKASPVSRPTRVRWVMLAAVPASLLVSVTSYVTTDFAVPLFWIAPLAIYLATFVLVFARRPILSHRLMSALMPFAVVVPLVLAAGQVRESFTLLVFPLIGLFVAAMVCHGELAASRPQVRHLTEFYLWLSLGGAIGGLFNVLVAPLIFKTTAEYPLGLLLACLVPATAPTQEVKKKRIRAARATRSSREYWLTLGIAAALGLLVLGLAYPASRMKLPPGTLRFVGVVFALPAIIALWFRQNHVRFAAALGAILLAAAFYSH
ncbi:MAG TPA: hypothetical protein VE176_07495, partial [Candidatus Limnocylindrales bacterium]|nr:hypothetical protein [Candidatus Limnocylindrales bacterium]